MKHLFYDLEWPRKKSGSMKYELRLIVPAAAVIYPSFILSEKTPITASRLLSLTKLS